MLEHNPITATQRECRPVVSGRYAIDVFRSDFGHCSNTADLFAQLTTSALGSFGGASEDLSTALNELLEWGFRCADDVGELCLEVSELGSTLRLCLTVPMAAESVGSVVREVSKLDGERARESFFSELAKPLSEASPLLGLYWLAGEYGQLQASPDPQLGVQLALDLTR